MTNLYKTGVFDNREMMAISGHKSERVFEKHIKVGVSEQADRIYKKMKVLHGGKEIRVGSCLMQAAKPSGQIDNC